MIGFVWVKSLFEKADMYLGFKQNDDSIKVAEKEHNDFLHLETTAKHKNT
jgi:hypothetical protein